MNWVDRENQRRPEGRRLGWKFPSDSSGDEIDQNGVGGMNQQVQKMETKETEAEARVEDVSAFKDWPDSMRQIVPPGRPGKGKHP